MDGAKLGGWVAAALVTACGVDVETGFMPGSSQTDGPSTDSAASSGAGWASTGASDAGGNGESTDDTGTDGSASGNNPKLDVGGDDGGRGNACAVAEDDLSGPGTCDEVAPPDSFDPVVEWTFEEDPDTGVPLLSLVIPLVGNFTDDDQSGTIDLCDTPDVVFVGGLFAGYQQQCALYVLDGASGAMHFKIPEDENISCVSTPAFADLDGDGLPQIVVMGRDAGIPRPKAFSHDGTLQWSATDGGQHDDPLLREGFSIALHDLDADGDAEILVGHSVYDHDGNLLWEVAPPVAAEGESTTAADLDGDGLLEVITAHAAYHHDGTVAWDLAPMLSGRGFPQVGALDDDPQPEVLITSEDGLWLIEHDGQVAFGPVRPTGVEPLDEYSWARPATIHDFDGDGEAEWASASEESYAAMQGPSATDVLWQRHVLDASGAAAGSAFDFLGDGIAEAMYADEWTLSVFDGETGTTVLTQERCSPTLIEYPVVADVDNDGSAEVLLVSALCFDNAPKKPALQVLGDVDSRWIQARRIWNQHTYHITHVREDGTLPSPPVNHWQSFNTFRTNAQIDGGSACIPAG